MVGALAVILYKYHGGYEDNKWLGIIGLLSGIIVVLVIYLDGGLDFREVYMTCVGYTFLDLFFGVCLLYVIHRRANHFTSMLVCNKLTTFFGKYSYSMYVFHPWIMSGLSLIMLWLRLEVNIVTTILYLIIAVILISLFSMVIWQLFEKRFLRLKSKFQYI